MKLADQTPPLQVFVSYSHRDASIKQELERFIGSTEEPVRFSSDENLMPGDVWEQRLQEIRQQADVYLLLVSENYLQSTRKDPELAEILARGKRDPAIKVIPIILEECAWGQTPIAEFQALPRFGKPIKEFLNREDAYTEIAGALTAIAQLKQNSRALELIRQEKEKKTGTLKLVECNLTTIPRDLLEMTELEELYLDRNAIRKIENLETLTRLKVLSMTYNELERIEHLDTLTRLQVLDLQFNKIGRIENLEKNTELKLLGLSSNQIDSLAGITHLQLLTTLYMGHNRLQRLDELSQLPNLKRITLTNNQIISIKPLLIHIKNGLNVALHYSYDDSEQGIFIKDNSTLAEPSIEVIEKGRSAVLKYFADAKTYGTRKLEIVKFILVGNSKVGKTNFSEFLRGADLTPNHNSTHLLDIKSWDAPFLRSESGTLMKVNIFDFGGQDYYHDSHRMYYSHDTAYILLWDTTTNNYSVETEAVAGQADALVYENFPLEYWLESINYNLIDKFRPSFQPSTQAIPRSGNSAPVLVLQNKIDLEEGRLDQKTLSERYPNIAGYFNLSLTKQKRTGILFEVLSDYLNALNLTGRQLIEFEYKIIDHYLNQPQPFRAVSLDEFWKACQDIINDPAVRFTKENAQIIAQILNAIGIVFYDKRSEDDGVVFTRINRLNELIKEIMDVAKRGNDKGFFRKEQVSHIEHHEDVLALLLRNNSILKINDTEYLAPQFLPVKPDSSVAFFLNAFTHNNLRYLYRAYFHKTLLLNLFARYLKGASIDTSAGIRNFPFWRNGIIVSRGEGTGKQMVFVELLKDTTRGIVNIWTMTPFRKNGLEREIEATLDELNKGWTVSKEISVNSSEFFDVQYLRDEAANKRFEFTQNGKTFSVNDFKHLMDFEQLPKKLFISYSSKNADFIRRFVTHLEILKSNGIIDPWYDRMIESGSKWDDAIRNEMKNSDVVIFLLSPDFLATEYIMKTEIPLAIKQLEDSKSKFFFIELQPCGWQRTELAQFQQTDDSGETKKNVISIGKPDNDAGWNLVINELEKKMSV
ncbi:hypothetical protein GCM10023189_58950 [Nibrella saemangeumensis]|uniref:TIR domain-containing protein n=1 Tax=Nibrella saemangeumensis TaxID=1084526 RepID=A0ABP8NT38_9BACT